MRYDASAFGVGFRWLTAITLLLAATWLPRLGDSSTALPAPEEPQLTFTVTTDADSGAGSLRQAILDANAAPGLDTIAFSIGTGPASVNTAEPLPDITDPVIIDGTTQPGFVDVPLINLPGGGLKITSGGSTVSAIAVTSSSTWIVLENGGGNTIKGCYIGVCPQSPTAFCGNTGNGILINESPNNIVGGSVVGDRNLISSNTNAGVMISGGASTGNVVIGNYIGVNPAGTAQSINGNYGVFIDNAPGNRIGGAMPGEGNLISGTGQGTTDVLDAGIRILGSAASQNIVQGNRLGPNAAGTGTITNRQHGVRVDDAPGTIIGGSAGTTPGGACTGACNLISGNLRGGVTITGAGATGTTIKGNFIGLNTSGTGILTNSAVGILVTTNASGTTIGGAGPAERNVIANGITFSAGAALNTVFGNYIGTDTTGTAAVSSLVSGVAVLMDTSTDNIIGASTGTTLGGACTGGCNLISGNNGIGLRITGPDSARNHVDYNYIGLNAAGTDALKNNGDAVYITNGAHDNIIGRLASTTRPAGVTIARGGSRCTQDDETQDYVDWDLNGSYTAYECRSGRSRTGVGEVKESLPGEFELYDSGLTVTDEGAELLFATDDLNPGLHIRDSEPGTSCGSCPAEGEQVYVGTVTVGEIGSAAPHDNIIAGLSCNYNAARTSSLVEVGQTCVLLRNCDSNRIANIDAAMAPNAVPEDVPTITLVSGTGNEISDIDALRLKRAIERRTLEFDLNANDIDDPNDPQDPDAGADNTQNHPVVFVISNGNGGARVGGSLNSTPNKRFRINLLIDDPVVAAIGQFGTTNGTTIQDTGLSFEVITDQEGNSPPFDVKYTGADADRLRVFAESIRATATLLPDPAISAPDATAIGDTSELSPLAKAPDPMFDFDNDGKTDIAVYRPGATPGAPSNWYILKSSDLSFSAVQFGIGEDVIVPGDHQGDDVTDFAVWRPSTGVWYVSRLTGNPSTNFTATPWGQAGDVPVTGDYDDDGSNDHAVFRPSTQTWYIRQSLTGTPLVFQFGLATDKPVPGDYDGDGRTDFAVYRNGVWYITACAGCPLRVENFGLATDQPVPGADIDGDGVDDIAVTRNDAAGKIWYWLESSTGSFRGAQFGVATDVPAPGDYDADNKTDLAVWRPSSGIWYVQRSTAGFFAIQWGQNGDIPVPRFQN